MNLFTGALQRALFCSKAENSLLKLLTKRIKATGPITVADYMKEVLTNPTYVSKN